MSTRTWLYLGAVIVGLSLMALGDPIATEAEPPVAAPVTQEDTRLADAKGVKPVAHPRSAEGAPLRAKTSEVTPLPAMRK